MKSVAPMKETMAPTKIAEDVTLSHFSHVSSPSPPVRNSSSPHMRSTLQSVWSEKGVRPDGQVAQKIWSGELNSPAGHCEQEAEEEEKEDLPGVQAVHVAAAVSSLYEPMEQAVQFDAPLLGAAVPIGHRTQEVVPGASAYFPGRQTLQDVVAGV